MKKLILIGGVIVVIIIILLFVMVSNLGPIIKTAVNTYGPRITKTDVSLSDVSVSVLSGEARLKDFYLGNPKGFKTPCAFKVGSIDVDLDEKSLIGDTIIINKIEIISPEITYEKTLITDNFKALLNNVKSAETSKASTEKKSKGSEAGKKIIIRDFILKDGNVNLATSYVIGQKSVTAALPDIQLKDIGEGTDGTSPAKAFEEIFSALYKQITSPDVAKALNESLKNLAKENVDTLRQDAEKQVKGVSEESKKQIENLLGK